MRARALAFAYRFSSGVRVSWASSTAFATLGTAVVTLLVLDQAPDRRGMASSLQACVGSLANGLVAGLVAQLLDCV